MPASMTNLYVETKRAHLIFVTSDKNENIINNTPILCPGSEHWTVFRTDHSFDFPQSFTTYIVLLNMV